jgi:hypothetical protein
MLLIELFIVVVEINILSVPLASQQLESVAIALFVANQHRLIGEIDC